MPEKSLATLLALSVLMMALAHPALAATKEQREAARRAELAAKVKDGILKLGIGPDARVEVKRRDATRLRGYVSEAGEAAFAVTDASTGATTQVPYDDVAKVKGNNLATGWKIAIGAGAIFALVLILVWTGAIGDAER